MRGYMGYSPADWEHQLMMLRGLTAATGVIHTAQQLQLKMWGGVAFQHIKRGEWEAHVDVDRKVVTYVLGQRKLFSWSRVHSRSLEVLERSVQWLLGPDWLLTVTEGGKPVFTGKRVSPDKQVSDERKSRVDGQ